MTEAEQRRRLAAAFRWSARLGFNEAVANHFSALVPGSDHEFLLNPRGAHFSRITASSLVRLDANSAGGPADDRADPTAWFLHAHLHRLVPHAKVILHTHMPYATSLAIVTASFLLYTLNFSHYAIVPVALLWSAMILLMDRALLATYRKGFSWWGKFGQFSLRFVIALLIAVTRMAWLQP